MAALAEYYFKITPRLLPGCFRIANTHCLGFYAGVIKLFSGTPTACLGKVLWASTAATLLASFMLRASRSLRDPAQALHILKGMN